MTTKTIKKSDFYKNKKVFQLVDIDVNKISVSNKEPYGTKNLSKLDIMIMMLLVHYV